MSQKEVMPSDVFEEWLKKQSVRPHKSPADIHLPPDSLEEWLHVAVSKAESRLKKRQRKMSS